MDEPAMAQDADPEVDELFLDDETPQKKLAAFDTADLLRRRLSLEEAVAVPLPLESNRGAAA